jgi:hypothetical protein
LGKSQPAAKFTAHTTRRGASSHVKVTLIATAKTTMFEIRIQSNPFFTSPSHTLGKSPQWDGM